jgi:hypothetical protein
MSNLHTAFLKCQPDEHGKALVNTATQYYSHTRLHHFLVCLRCPPCIHCCDDEIQLTVSSRLGREQ